MEFMHIGKKNRRAAENAEKSAEDVFKTGFIIEKKQDRQDRLRRQDRNKIIN
jgi:hypothetical protein